MFPAQTSLIPVQIALARFWESGGNIFGNYPYWYLGTTPFRFLTGPVFPYFIVSLHKIFPVLSLYAISYILLAICWIFGGIGLYFLMRELGGSKTLGALGGLLFIFGPIVPFLFCFSDGLYLVTFSFLPLGFFFYAKLLRNLSSKKLFFLVSLFFSFLFLLDTLVIPTLILGMLAIPLSTETDNEIEPAIKVSVSSFSLAILISTIWYTPYYWFNLLAGPSFGGAGLISVIASIAKLLPSFLAIAAAIFVVRMGKKKSRLANFCFYWMAIFLFLSFLRFLADPDFWLDWSAYGAEIQLGLAMGSGLLLSKMYSQKSKIYSLLIVASYLLFFTFIFNKYVLGTMQKDIKLTLEYRLSKKLNMIMKPGQRVFVSGTTAFWLNSFYDIAQVRGGIDQVSVDPNWRRAAWEIREGESPHKALQALKNLKVDYLVVHTENSQEFYHDFRNLKRFESNNNFKKIFDKKGDLIYKVL